MVTVVTKGLKHIISEERQKEHAGTKRQPNRSPQLLREYLQDDRANLFSAA